MALANIKPNVKYDIMVDAPEGTLQYRLSYQGEPAPAAVYYDEAPIEPIPASLPVLPPSNQSYQNSNNQGVEGLLTGRKCSNCVFYEAESGNCSRWNALVRSYYWCISWKTMQPVIAEENQFTKYIDQTAAIVDPTIPVEEDNLYNFFIGRVKDPNTQEPNLSNLLTPLNALFSTYGAYVYGDILRRMIDSGNAFDFDNVPMNLFFTTQEDFLNAIEFVNNGGLVEFDTPLDQHDSVQQHLVTYELSKRGDSTLPMNYPQSLTINLHGSFYGEPINILSQMDFVNGKIAYNPKFTASRRHVLLDNRFLEYEQTGRVKIDIVKQSIRERLLKFLNDNSKPYIISNPSAITFIQWVGDRAFTSESWQELYSYMLTVDRLSADDQQLITLIQNTLGEVLIDEPARAEIPLITNVINQPTKEETE